MNRTRFALTGKCGAFGASGLSASAPRAWVVSRSARMAGSRAEPATRERSAARRWMRLVMRSSPGEDVPAGGVTEDALGQGRVGGGPQVVEEDPAVVQVAL